MVDGVRVHVGPTIKYLGLTLDGRWDFRAHFRDLAPRLRKADLALVRLMQTQGRPGWHARRLYVGVVLSIALYGASIWAPQLLATAQGKNLMRQALRAVAVRAIRGFRSVAQEARGLTFHLVQVMTEHGCFGHYLNRIRKEHTTRCHHCPELDDTVHHTLAECPAWDRERGVLARAVGCRESELSFPRMARAMCGSEEGTGVPLTWLYVPGGHKDSSPEPVHI
ncbi:uncharacterized protein LOC112588303 [Harpegnathos saltator]|uniref:uncharacterized protein LOC112588303 n=1 Tax=Harpegnathos saltator TaxID=610380 RepID=UPI000DBECFE4|nr:uncharacterized protein LOC112588303 [Harpegnathos saltator]